MNDPLTVSVIVPVYHVEPYLDRCVHSIADQTYGELEILLVDDGSPDGCPALCDTWAEKDSRIRVIHKENGGLSDARNAGMAAATGEYIAFVDGDDRIAPEMVERLLQAILRDGSDIAACAVEMVWEDGTPSRSLTVRTNCVLSRTEAQSALIGESLLKQPVWYKLYRSGIIRDIPFEVGKYHEDVFWSYRAVGNAGRVSIIDYVGYYYTQRAGSIMGEGYSLRRLDAVEAKLRRQTYLEAEMPELASQGRVNLLFTCLYHGQLALRHLKGEERKRAVDVLKKAAADHPLTPEDKKSLRFEQRVWAALSERSVVLTCRLRNALRIGM